MKTAIIIVDMQNDFVEGGALAVAGGRALVPVINRMVKEMGNSRDGVLVVTTQDWHPLNHSQFDTQGGPWPVHCVAGTTGADLVEGLELPIETKSIFKGEAISADGYSGFDGFEYNSARSLDMLLKENNIEHVYVCGIATDYCVKATVLDAVKLGYSVTLAASAIAGVESKTTSAALDEMGKAMNHRGGVRFLTFVDTKAVE